jgi:hypothetical protein
MRMMRNVGERRGDRYRRVVRARDMVRAAMRAQKTAARLGVSRKLEVREASYCHV